MQSAVRLPTFSETIAVCIYHKWSTVILVTLPLLGATIYAVVTPPKYEATSKVLVKSGREYLPQAEIADRNVASPSTTMLDTIGTEVEILTSEDLIMQVAAAISPGRLYPDLVAPRPAPWSWTPSWLPWANWLSPSPDEPANPTVQAAENLGRDTIVAPIKLSNVIQVAVRNQDPAVAVDTLRRLLSAYQGRHVAAFAQKRGAVVEAELTATRAALGQLEQERSDYRNAHTLFSAPEQRTALIAQRARTTQELDDAEVRKGTLQRQIDYLNSQLAALPRTVAASTTTQQSPVADETNRRMREMQAHERQMLSLFTDHSTMLDATRAGIAANAGFLAGGRNRSSAVQTAVNPLIVTVRGQLIAAGAELTPLNGKIEQLRALIVEDDQKLRRIGADEIAVLDMDRRIAELGSVDAILRQRLSDGQLLDGLDGARVASISVIEEPHALPRPVAPRKRLAIMAGLIAGLLLGGFAILLRLTFGTRLISEASVERLLGLDVLASLPVAKRQPSRIA